MGWLTRQLVPLLLQLSQRALRVRYLFLRLFHKFLIGSQAFLAVRVYGLFGDILRDALRQLWIPQRSADFQDLRVLQLD